ncbi:MAG: ABC transporter ATP-binding protein [Dehalococcoidia bacterium]|nr:ABC transporter ATP-binding protein [Chloroflexi bacterium CFX7]MCK6565892.1 ABC transporter ATP-binding protein [Dehalococcoidia bacterium]NUQ55773.1 ABC transporter ATP-binding protein [Dehalococcoidia bacterium]
MKLAARDLVLAYDGRIVVDNVSFEIDAGEMVAIVGPNGSGKSTLLRGLSRLQKPVSGQVLLGETDIRHMGAREVARILAILPQSPDAGTDLTVRELAARGRYPHQGILQRATRADYEAVEWALTAADVEDLASRTLGSLSGGERQRAWIALALAQQPKVLLLDEPTSFLDIQHQVEVMHLLRRLNHEGMTVVTVLHDLPLAGRFADRVIAINLGRVELDGPPARVFEPVALERVFNVPMVVLADPVTGLPIPLPAPDPHLCAIAPAP